MAISRKEYAQLSREEKLEVAYRWQYVQLVQPTKVFVSPWIRAERYWYAPAYPKPTERCGKWMVYIPIDRVDAVWSIVRDAIVVGELGRAAKVATMAENSRTVYKDKRVLCVYTYDSDDLEDLKRVLVRMRELGINQEAWYKEDRATRAGQYSSNSNGPVTRDFAPENSIEFFPTKQGAK